MAHSRLINFITNRFLELIILPTEQCNFRCVYCYEDFSVGKMKPETVAAIKQLINQRFHSLDVLKISWFGGEPMVAKDIVYEINDYVMVKRKDHPTLKFISGMTTNGYQLKQQVLAKLISLGISSFQISLDGTEKMHDKTRLRMNGSGSFQTIWHNLLQAKESKLNFSIVLRIHVTPDNFLNIYELVKQIKVAFAHDKRFSVFFKAIENLGGPKAGQFNVMHGMDKKSILAKLHLLLGESMAVKKLDDHGCYVCYAAQTNSFVIRANGKIAKCTVAFNDDRNELGELRPDGTMLIAPDKLALWSRGLKSQKEAELSCPMRNLPRLN